MARKRSKLTPLQTEYKKQQERINRFIKRAEKRGYTFQEGIVPEMPKRVTRKALEEIKRINAPKLYAKSEYYRPAYESDYGYHYDELRLSGKERRKLERKASARKGQETRAIRKLINEEDFTRSEAFDLYHHRFFDYKNKDDINDYKNELTQMRYNSADYTEDWEEQHEQPVIQITPPEVTSPYKKSLIEQREDLKKQLAEVEKQIKDQTGLTDREDLVEWSEKHNPFYKQLKEQIDKDAKEAHESYKQRRKQYKEMREEIQKMEDGVLKYIEKMIAEWEGVPGWTPYWERVKQKDKNLLHSMLQGAINSEGRTEVARRLQENADRVIELASFICYGSGGKESSGRNDLNMAFAEFSSIIMGRPLTFGENTIMTEQAEEGIVTDET